MPTPTDPSTTDPSADPSPADPSASAPAAPRPLTAADVEAFAGVKNLLLTTYRRDGTAVPTPVWFVVHEGRLVTTTLADTGKVKRLRNDPRVTVAPCTVRGVPTGEAFSALARLLPPDASRDAVRRVDRRYALGWFVHTAERLIRRQRFVGIAIDPV